MRDLATNHRRAIDALQIAASVTVVVLLFAHVRHIAAQNGDAAPNPKEVLVPVPAVIGSRPVYYGSSNAAFTLVEFADYECPPCGRACVQIRSIVDKSRGRLRVTYRNFPLKSVHARAYACAIAAEVARAAGRYWPAHDALYAMQPKLSDERIASALKVAGVPPTPTQAARLAAKDAVDEGIAAGAKCGVSGTPTFMLCTPGGRVYRLGTLSQATGLTY